MPRCPRCRSDDVAKLVYRALGPEDIADGAIDGGRVLRPDSPAWRCRRCHLDFGTAYERVRKLRL